MNISYKWQITGLKKAPSIDELSDVITHINFSYTGTDADSGESAAFTGACPVSSPNSESFTPFNDVTEADVIEWAKANHPVTRMNNVIEKQINQKITPKNIKALLPWNN